MSDNILIQLYRGNYRPFAQPYCPDPVYDGLMERKNDMEERFEKTMPEEMRAEFAEYLRLSGEVGFRDEETAFCEGVRLGIKLMSCAFAGK